MPLIGMTSDLAGKYSGQEHKTKGQKPNGRFRILSHAFSQIEDVPQRNRKVQGSPFLERIPRGCPVLPTLAPAFCCRRGTPSRGGLLCDTWK